MKSHMFFFLFYKRIFRKKRLRKKIICSLNFNQTIRKIESSYSFESLKRFSSLNNVQLGRFKISVLYLRRY